VTEDDRVGRDDSQPLGQSAWYECPHCGCTFESGNNRCVCGHEALEIAEWLVEPHPDTERLDWLMHNFWNGWSLHGSHQWAGGKPKFTVSHKSGDPQITRDDLRAAIDAARKGEEE
jgi:hypothetical protein